MRDLLRSGWHDLTHRPEAQEPALDALRAVAVLLVVCTHYARPEWELARGPETFLSRWPMFYFGWTGVDLFFVLSGLLIGTQLWRELATRGTIDVPRFLLKRGFRIWPLYVVTLAAIALVGSGTRWPDWLFLSNYWHTGYPRSWSLSTEEQFYLIVPLLVLATRKVWPIVALISVIPALRVLERDHLTALGYSSAATHDQMVTPIHLHAEALLVGLVLAWCVVHRPRWMAKGDGRVSRRGLAVLMAGCVTGLALDVANKEVFAFTALAFIFGSVTYFVLVDRSPVTRPLHARAFYPISRLSFGMYLNHFLVLPGSTAWVVRHVHGPTPLVFVLGLSVGTVISIGAAAGTFLAVEHPFLVLRKRVLGHRHQTTVAPEVTRAGSTLLPEGMDVPLPPATAGFQ